MSEEIKHENRREEFAEDVEAGFRKTHKGWLILLIVVLVVGGIVWWLLSSGD